jgi:hypothetical protein
MVLEALIDPDTGNFIVIKPEGSPWGRCEVNSVHKLDDDAIAKIATQTGVNLTKAIGDRPHIVYPLKVEEHTTTTHNPKDKDGNPVLDKDGNPVSITRTRTTILDPSLVKMLIDPAKVEDMKVRSEKLGVLTSTDAAVAIAVIDIDNNVEVKSIPVSKTGGVVVVSNKEEVIKEEVIEAPAEIVQPAPG